MGIDYKERQDQTERAVALKDDDDDDDDDDDNVPRSASKVQSDKICYFEVQSRYMN